MRVYQSIPVAATKEVLLQVKCNVCGEDVTPDSYTETYTHFKINFGYGSPYDGETWEFDLCHDCLENFVNRFTIKPTRKGAI